MPLVSCDDPKGARFSVVGKTGRCEVVIDRAGRPNFGFVANDDNEAAQVEEMMSRMSLRRCDPNVTVVVSSDEEDELAQFVTPPVTPARSRTKKTGSPAQRGGAAASSFVPSNQPRAAVFAPPSPAHMYVPATPGNTPATTISSPSSLGPLSPLIFADAPVPDVIPAHPTAPSYIGIGPFNPDAWGVPLVWSRRYAAPWLPTPKCGKKWHVVRIGFEIGTVSNPSFVSPEKIVVMVKLAMLAFGISLRLWSTGAKAQSVDRAIPSPASSYCVLFSIVIVIRGSLLLNMEINCVGVHICGSVVRPTLTLLSPRTVEDDDNDGPAPDCGVSTPAESDSYTGTAVLSSSDNTNINDNGEPTLDCGVDWRRSLLAPLAFLKITFNTAKAYLIKSSSLMAALGADCATTALSTKDSIGARTVSIQDFTALHASHALTPRPHSTEFSFPADIVREWEREVVAWELDPTRKPNPFDDGESKQDNMAAIRLELAKEEMGEISSDSVGAGPAAFLVAGMEIEEKQHSLLNSMQNEHTTHQAASLQEQRNALLRRIVAWREIQQVHMPVVASDLLPDAQYSQDKPERIPLFLPSEASSLNCLC
ncbi:hypothetical protein EYR36_010605 [Pleurotus pulmonarius]|nr:hypothetical protein EYR36_010605 [Pleurotus pulmonarius]